MGFNAYPRKSASAWRHHRSSASWFKESPTHNFILSVTDYFWTAWAPLPSSTCYWTLIRQISSNCRPLLQLELGLQRNPSSWGTSTLLPPGEENNSTRNLAPIKAVHVWSLVNKTFYKKLLLNHSTWEEPLKKAAASAWFSWKTWGIVGWLALHVLKVVMCSVLMAWGGPHDSCW